MSSDATERAELDQLRAAARASGLFTWSCELGTGDVVDAKLTGFGVREALGVAALPAELGAALDLCVIADDRAQVLGELRTFLAGTSERHEIEFRIRHADGSVHWTLARLVAVRAAGRAVRFTASCVDITSTRRNTELRYIAATEEARQAVAHLQLTTELSGVTMWSYDLANGHPTPTTTSVLPTLGYGAELPISWRERLALAVLPEDQPHLLDAMQACIAGKTPTFEVECRVRSKDGLVRWLLVRGVTARDATGRARAISGTAVDVTRLKQVEEDARVANERLELAAQVSGFSVTECDLRGATTADQAMAMIDSAPERQRQWPPSQDPFKEAIVPEDLPRLTEAVRACIAGTAPEPLVEYRRRNLRDGTVRWRLGRGKCYFDERGAPVRYIGVSLDIEDLRKAEENERQATEQLRLTTQLSGVNVWSFKLRDTEEDLARAMPLQHVSGTMSNLGYDGDAPPTLAARLREVVYSEDQARIIAATNDCIAGKLPLIDTECRLVAKDGSVHWRLLRGITTRDSAGRPLMFTGTVVDIERLKQTEEELQRAAAELEKVKDRLELAVAGSKACTWDFEIVDGDLANARVAFNNYWELLGYPAPPPGLDNLAAITAHVVAPDDRESLAADFQAFFERGAQAWEREGRVVHRDGTERWQLSRGVVERDRANVVTRFTGTTIDITDRKLTEQKLRESEERFRGTFENAAVGMILTDLEGRFLEFNSRFCEFLGYAPEELAGRRFVEFMVPDEVAEDFERQRSVVRGDTPSFTRDKRYLRKDGAIVWGNITVSVIQRHADGTAAHVMGILQDITERKLTEQRLRESEQRFRHLFENAAVGMIVCTTDARILESNARWREFLGYTGDEVAGRSFYDFMVQEEVTAEQERLRSILRGDAPSFNRDKRYIRKDGSIVWGNITVSVVQRDDDGTATRTMGILQDISERKELEAEVEKATRRLELAMRGSDIAVYHGEFHDPNPENAQWTYFNMWEPLGYDAAAAPTEFEQRKGLAIHPDDEGAVVTQFAEAVQAGSPVLYTEHRVLHRDGSVRWRLSRGTLLYDDAGRLTSLVGTEVDITRLKQIEAELLRAREAAESANRAKDEFLANVSHEIRTPMNAILGMTELALDSAPTEHQRQLLSTVRSAAKNLLSIINDLLDFSKIASGKLTLDRTDFSLRAAVGDTLRALAVRAHRKGLELLCHVRPDVPDALEGDIGRLRQVLMNLVGNAIKFTPQGEVEIDVAAEPSTGPTVALIFTVRDTGIGIARDKQAAIFHAFEQEDSSTTRKYGGTGLGLTISAQLASLMDGDITVQSAPGCGSTFRFTARFARSAKPDAATVSPERLANLRVLVVDDKETNRRILVEWLTSWRMQPASAPTASQALAALASAHSAGTPFSVVLLDARMPDTDGIALARSIRERWEASAPRLILLSSDDSAELASLAKDNGVHAYLLKPVQQSELLEAIWATMNLDVTASSNGAEGAHPERSRPLRVLVAEDNELNVTLLRELLSQHRHIAQFAGDGRAALELALQSEFDLMLLDVHMPELDGFEVVAAIRAHERGTNQHLRIIALTARSSARDRERCLAAGMDEFLAKPIEAKALWATMDRLVARWPLAAPRVVEPGLLDGRAVLRACGGQAPILEKLRLVLRRTLPAQMARVRTAIESANLAEVREAAHQLVATVGAFSTVTAGIASTLEDAAIREDRDACAALGQRLGSLCDALLDATEMLTLESLAL